MPLSSLLESIFFSWRIVLVWFHFVFGGHPSACDTEESTEYVVCIESSMIVNKNSYNI